MRSLKHRRRPRKLRACVRATAIAAFYRALTHALAYMRDDPTDAGTHDDESAADADGIAVDATAAADAEAAHVLVAAVAAFAPNERAYERDLCCYLEYVLASAGPTALASESVAALLGELAGWRYMSGNAWRGTPRN